MTAIMKNQPTPSDHEVLTGLVERVTYQNAENGFCVLRVKARGQRELVTLVGHAAAISAGEWITASGCWVNDRTHGQQFKARFLKTSAPTSVEGIEKYLASGMIRGIGPVYAKKLLRAFGDKVSLGVHGAFCGPGPSWRPSSQPCNILPVVDQCRLRANCDATPPEPAEYGESPGEATPRRSSAGINASKNKAEPNTRPRLGAGAHSLQ